MSRLFRITPHPGQDIMPAARELDGNLTVFFIGYASPSGPPACQILHSGLGYHSESVIWAFHERERLQPWKKGVNRCEDFVHCWWLGEEKMLFPFVVSLELGQPLGVGA